MIRSLVAVVTLAFFGWLHAQPATITPPEVPDAAQTPPAGDGANTPSPSTWSYTSRGTAVLWASARSEMGTLGQYCNGDVGFCVWMLVLRDVQCTQGEEHPILLNTDQLAAPHVIRCVGSVAGRGATFAFTDFDSIDEAVRGAQQLAIAVPEQGDKIVVTHFALDGATAALQRLREALNEQSSSAEHDRKADKERPSRLPARRGEPSSSA
jgi:hypothetical protein